MEPNQESTALVHQPQSTASALQPMTIQDADWLATRLATSGLSGKATRPEAVLAIILTGRELGLTAMQSLRGIDSIDGKPALQAATMAALCLQRTEVCEYFDCIETSDTVAVYETKRRGRPPRQMRYTIEQAKSAGLTSKTNWKNSPADMLRARAAAKLARMVYPDLMLGVYTPDELDDSREEVRPQRAPYARPIEGSYIDAEVTPLRTEQPTAQVQEREQASQPSEPDEREQLWRAKIDDAADLATLSAISPLIAADYGAGKAPASLRSYFVGRAQTLTLRAPLTTPEQPAPLTGMALVDALAERMVAAQSQAELDAVAADAVKAREAGTLDDKCMSVVEKAHAATAKRFGQAA